MKKAFTIAIFITIALALTAQKDDYLNLKQFDIKSGKVVYKIEGKTKGTKTLWFDDYGRSQYEHTVTTTKMFGMTTKEEKLKIRDREWMYDINLIEKTGTKMKVQDGNEMIQTMTATSTDEQLIKLGNDIQKDFDVKEMPSETILGRECKVHVSGKLNSKHWEYKRVPLKLTLDMGGILGSSNEEATSFDENISIPASKFTVPSGIDIQEIDMNQINGLMGIPDDED
jgi:hypothetical protein